MDYCVHSTQRSKWGFMQSRANRYSIQRPVEYYMRTPAGPVMGKGQTLNISRRGVLFRPQDELMVGKRIELLVTMEPGMEEDTFVTLFVQGVTVRSDDAGTAVAVIMCSRIARLIGFS